MENFAFKKFNPEIIFCAV